MIKSNIYHSTRFIVGLLTILAIVGHPYIPQKKLFIAPNNKVSHSIYGFENSTEWIDENIDEWQCHYKETDPYGCGYSIQFNDNIINGLDFSKYDGMNIKIDYIGSAPRIRLFMRNYDATYDSGDPLQSAKFMSVVIKTRDLQEEIYVRINEFSVNEWWVRDYDAPREHASPMYNNIITLGTDFITKGHHHVRINKIELVGDQISKEMMYLFIIGIWISLAIWEAANRFYQMYLLSRGASKEIETLASNYKKLEEQKNEFEALSTTDVLTGVMNRAGINQFLEKLFGGDYAKNQIGLLIFDLDNFKRINDNRGHDAGDRILQDVSRIINENIRQSDVFGRWGGEEFLLICPQTNREHLLVLAEKLRSVISEHTFEPQSEAPLIVTVSIGATSVNEHESFTSVFKRADEALYEAKHHGRNTVIFKNS